MRTDDSLVSNVRVLRVAHKNTTFYSDTHWKTRIQICIKFIDMLENNFKGSCILFDNTCVN